STGGCNSSPPPNQPIISAGESSENSSQMRVFFFALSSSSSGTSTACNSARRLSISATAAGALRGAQAQPSSKTEQSENPSMPAPTGRPARQGHGKAAAQWDRYAAGLLSTARDAALSASAA